ncbi:gametocyte-specific factor 1 isoform X2 [Gouania willdenowi]|uniref:Gametocyte-specific factor 1-like n=1 Tax=Gouania willdenowi TaxID=441366 RepID=A0A8C5EP27_GOUWI|nr:gametocyte-specific factor 1-like isoform X2 [Gouania willdenowi]
MAGNIHCGSTCSPSRARAADVTEQVVEDLATNTEKKDIDPERLLQCPYDANHKIRSCRFPYHLIKCRANHPKLAKELKTCPFNARHLVPKHELMHHTKICGDRIEPDHAAGGSTEPPPWHVPVSTWVNPDPSENWDSEVDDSAAPFVWGPKTNLSETQPVNNMGPQYRAPNVLPWGTPKQ